MRRDITRELKELRLHGMASSWLDLTAQGESGTASSRWLIEHLLQAEHTDRAVRSVSHQMHAAKFPIHRDLAGFDFEASKVDKHLVKQLATLDFTDTHSQTLLHYVSCSNLAFYQSQQVQATSAGELGFGVPRFNASTQRQTAA